MVGEVRPEKRRLVEVGEQVLRTAIGGDGPAASGGRKWPRQMQQRGRAAGFSVVTQYVGHGIGRIMHENPQVPNFVNRELRKHDFRLEEGLVLAVEPMVNMGRRRHRHAARPLDRGDRDGLPSVHVEHTLAITREGVYVVTADEETWSRRDAYSPLPRAAGDCYRIRLHSIFAHRRLSWTVREVEP